MYFYLFLICIALIIYHHVCYPLIMKMVSKDLKTNNLNNEEGNVGILISSFNDGEYLEKKINNTLNSSLSKKHIFIYNDGSTDDSEQILKRFDKNPLITIINKDSNKGKLDSINHYIKNFSKDFKYTLFTDTSSYLDKHAGKIMMKSFNSKNIAVCSSSYYPHEDSKDSKYWNYQRSIKIKESNMGNVIGVHGSGYMVKNEFLSLLDENTINDDFIIPSNAIKKGGKVVYSNAKSKEMELDSENNLNYERRIRIGAGNIQQVFKSIHLLNFFKHPLTSFNFLSGKLLRTFMPFIYISSLFFALNSDSIVANMYINSNILLFIYLFLYSKYKENIKIKHLNIPYYIVKSYYNSMIGMLKYLQAKEIKGWYNPLLSKRRLAVKRCFDLFCAIILFILSTPVLIISILALKIESPKDPIFFKQKRLGQSLDNEKNLFNVLKLRTMIVNAEETTGAVFASKNDPRITKVGAFLRKTRIDEIPQFINVIKGDMSIVGPRPERPEIIDQIDFPFAKERTKYMKPGITGMAQILVGYNEDINSLSNKFEVDKSYQESQNSILSTIYHDCKIMINTIFVVISMKGL